MDPNIYALVLDTLNRATSQDTEVLKPAEKKLQEWETEPGFYSVLLNVLTNHSIDVNVRWLAVMCLKNGVERYWRRNAPHAITDDEKHKLRQGILTSPVLNEPVTQIATQQAVLISKIARFDCPNNWPNLVPDLICALKAPQPLVQHRSLLIFHHVVKALASKRLVGDRRTFSELTNSVYPFILQLWHENTQVFLRNIQEGAATDLITEHLEKALLCLRILRKLTVFGFKNAHDSEDAVAFLNVVFDRAKTSLECRKLLKGRGIYPLELCEKFIIHLTKVALGVLCFHPFSYVPLIRPSLEFALFYCFTEQGMSLIYERFTIQCLNILKTILQCVEYKLPKGEAVNDPLVLQAHQVKQEVLDERTVCHMCRHLVAHYFPLSGDDLALWDAEPESFATDEAGESWKYSLRPCTESVFMELFRLHRTTLAPELVRMLGALQQSPAAPDDLPAILNKDAVYNAVGLAAFELYDDVDFDEWFTNVLSQELKIKDNNYRIIRRRALGECAPSMRPWILSVVNESTKLSEPAHVYLLEDALELWLAILETSHSADPAMLQLADNLYPILECDTKMHVLHVVSYVTERCGARVARDGGGGAGPLFAYLPQLWHHAAHHHMLRAAALAAIVHLVKKDKIINESIPSVIGAVTFVITKRILEGDDLPMVLSVQLCLLSRVILLSSDLFYKAVQEAANGLTEYDSDPAKVLNKVLHVWTEKMNLVTQVERWKVVGLGLAALLTTQNATVLQRFPAILLNLTEVLNDVMKTEDNGTYVE
ncbi:Importin-11 [Papilio machaon]|uniref:Importin-11 n=1 Tax=Papilio machaon TaxID=76193 RepID=A0A194R9Y7_PAPMA|nr:Importin-11 [Papilio machaon]